jgi:nitroreductase
MGDNTTNVEIIYSAGRIKYVRADLMKMEPVPLRALLRERIHHTIEVEIYPILLGKKKMPTVFGLQPQLIYEVWQERGLPEEGDDFIWARKYLALARRLRDGEEVKLDVSLPEPFTDGEMAIVEKLINTRTSIRDWAEKEVPDWMIEKILEAGRAAPTGCNKSVARFIVISDPEEKKMVWSDIPTDHATLIVLCYDRRVYEVDGQIESVPHNMMLDCGAAADHMLLMAHALGLAGIWLTCLAKTAKRFHKKRKLPDYIGVAMHIAIGWGAAGIIKSGRLPLSEMVIS